MDNPVARALLRLTGVALVSVAIRSAARVTGASGTSGPITTTRRTPDGAPDASASAMPPIAAVRVRAGEAGDAVTGRVAARGPARFQHASHVPVRGVGRRIAIELHVVVHGDILAGPVSSPRRSCSALSKLTIR